MLARVKKHLFAAPYILWSILFFVAPVTLILTYSFMERGLYGGIVYNFTLENLVIAFDELYFLTILRTIKISILNTFLCFLLGLPLAIYISSIQSNKKKNVLLVLLILPFWTNVLIRTFAWMVLLGSDGIINGVLLKLNIVDEALQFLYNPIALQLGLLYSYLPFMILPIYAALEKIDRRLILASKDLGASSFQTLSKILIPLSLPGIMTGCFLVFAPTLGEFVIPDLIGGAKTPMIGNIIKDQFLSARNWPLGSALSLLVMAIILLSLLVANKRRVK